MHSGRFYLIEYTLLMLVCLTCRIGLDLYVALVVVGIMVFVYFGAEVVEIGGVYFTVDAVLLVYFEKDFETH